MADDVGPGFPANCDEETLAALAQVAEYAHERAGSKPGFDCVVSLATWELLPSPELRALESEFLDQSERAQRFADIYHSTPELHLPLINLTLEAGLDHPDEAAKVLCQRIVNRMAVPSVRGFVKPLFYCCTAKTGLAMAIAVVDEYWTEDW